MSLEHGAPLGREGRSVLAPIRALQGGEPSASGGVMLIGVLCALLWLEAVAGGAESPSCGVIPSLVRVSRIVNGNKVHPYQFPWMVSIQTKKQHQCGGALIARDFVVTAAHCVSADLNVTVVAGLYHLWDEGVEVNGTAIVHPLYDVTQSFMGVEVLHFDVALIHLHNPVPFSSSVHPICLPRADEDLRIGDQVHLAGWGQEATEWDKQKRRKHTSLPPPPRGSAAGGTLKRLALHIEDYDACTESINNYFRDVVEVCNREEFDRDWCDFMIVWVNVSLSTARLLARSVQIEVNSGKRDASVSHQVSLCAAPKTDGQRRAPCYGDSGSPLMKMSADGTWSVVGVASWGPTDCIVRLECYKQPTIFANVRRLLDWVESTVEQTRYVALSAEATNDGMAFAYETMENACCIAQATPALRWSVVTAIVAAFSSVW